MESIIVRVAKKSDKSAIVDFQIKMAMETENEILDTAVVEKGVRAVLDDPAKATYFVAEDNKGIVGCIMVTDEWSDWRNGWVWWLQSLYVLQEFRKKGVFTALFEHIKVLMQSTDDLKGIRLYVDKRNKNAQKIYDLIGMTAEHYITYELMK